MSEDRQLHPQTDIFKPADIRQNPIRTVPWWPYKQEIHSVSSYVDLRRTKHRIYIFCSLHTRPKMVALCTG